MFSHAGLAWLGSRLFERAVKVVDDDEGQSTVEYLVATLGILVVVVTLGLLASVGKGGLFSRLAVKAASHAIGGRNPGDALLDILLF